MQIEMIEGSPAFPLIQLGSLKAERGSISARDFEGAHAFAIVRFDPFTLAAPVNVVTSAPSRGVGKLREAEHDGSEISTEGDPPRMRHAARPYFRRSAEMAKLLVEWRPRDSFNASVGGGMEQVCRRSICENPPRSTH